MFKYIFLIVLIIFTGCSHKDQPYVTKKVYKKISKDAVLNAAKKLFILADKKQYLIDSYRNKLVSSKVRLNNQIISVNLVQDMWILEVVQYDNKTKAHLSLMTKPSVDDSKIYNTDKYLHKMFWARIDYLLGIEKQWFNCSKYFKESSNTYDGVLCDEVFMNSTLPTKDDIIKDTEIIVKPKEIFTLDQVDAEIYKATDLSIIKKNNDVLKVDEETIKNEEENNSKKEVESEEELLKLKTEMNTIINEKGNTELLNIDTIIDKNKLIKENSEFNLEPEIKSDKK